MPAPQLQETTAERIMRLLAESRPQEPAPEPSTADRITSFLAAGATPKREREQQPPSFGPRLAAGFKKDFSKTIDALFPPPPPPTLQHLPPGAAGPPRQVAAEAVGIATRAGNLVGDLFRPGGERRSGFREASRQALLTGDTGPTQELIGGGVQEALELGAQFTGGPQTAERIGRVAEDPSAALGRFADSPILGSIMPVLDVALMGGSTKLLNRSLQAARPEVQAAEATARAAEQATAEAQNLAAASQRTPLTSAAQQRGILETIEEAPAIRTATREALDAARASALRPQVKFPLETKQPVGSRVREGELPTAVQAAASRSEPPPTPLPTAAEATLERLALADQSTDQSMRRLFDDVQSVRRAGVKVVDEAADAVPAPNPLALTVGDIADHVPPGFLERGSRNLGQKIAAVRDFGLFWVARYPRIGGVAARRLSNGFKNLERSMAHVERVFESIYKRAGKDPAFGEAVKKLLAEGVDGVDVVHIRTIPAHIDSEVFAAAQKFRLEMMRIGDVRGPILEKLPADFVGPPQQLAPSQFRENYLPIINELRKFGPDIPTDFLSANRMRFFNPHVLQGPAERLISETPLEDLMRMRFYAGYRAVHVNPRLAFAEKLLKASEALNNYGFKHVGSARKRILDVPAFDRARVMKATDVLDKIGESRPMTQLEYSANKLKIPSILGHRGTIETFIDNSFSAMGANPRIAERTAQLLTRNLYRALLGGNVGTVVKNLTQTINPAIQRGFIPTALAVGIQGPQALASAATRLPAFAVRTVTGGRVNLPTFVPRLGRSREVLAGGSSNLFRRAPSSTRGKVTRFADDVLFGGFEWSEADVNRGIAAWSGMLSEKFRQSIGTTSSVGKTGRIRAGIETAWTTQFLYSAIDRSAVLSRGPMGRMFGALTSFPKNQAVFLADELIGRPIEQIKKLAKTWREPGIGRELLLNTPQEFMPLVRFYLMTGWTIRIAEELGLDFEDVAGLSPIMAPFRFGIPFAAIEPIVSLAEWMSTEIGDATDQEKVVAADKFAQDFNNYVPFSNQARKIGTMMRTLEQGGRPTKRELPTSRTEAFLDAVPFRPTPSTGFEQGTGPRQAAEETLSTTLKRAFIGRTIEDRDASTQAAEVRAMVQYRNERTREVREQIRGGIMAQDPEGFVQALELWRRHPEIKVADILAPQEERILGQLNKSTRTVMLLMEIYSRERD